ncbi:DEKNAAC102872 [Brettanomyces naardenensis]|uniref:DEKNAAC102872 n=1 Tax=Brettanomyces naardenensis TaxID=13370 RepID=A0A448YLP7_BRENA|nr:DEKNAAC102872 [Brettanomyces naardenensis]
MAHPLTKEEILIQKATSAINGPISKALKSHIDTQLNTDVERSLKPELAKFIASLPPQFRLQKKGKNVGEPVPDGKVVPDGAAPIAPTPTTSSHSSIKKDQNRKARKGYIDRELPVDEAVTLLQLRSCILVSLDIEVWERKQGELTEIGLALYNPRYQKHSLFPHIVSEHFVIKENYNLRNGRFVPDAKTKNITGESTIMSMDEARRSMNCLFEKLGPDTVIVGHGVNGDLTFLDSVGIHVPMELKIIDTQSLWYSIFGHKHVRGSLGFILDKLSIPNAFLHNGANDAYYTLVACLMMGSPDIRNNAIFREKRKAPEELDDTERLGGTEKLGPEGPKESIDGNEVPVQLPDKVTIRCEPSDEALNLKSGRKRGKSRKRNPEPNTFFHQLTYNAEDLDKRIDAFLK